MAGGRRIAAGAGLLVFGLTVASVGLSAAAPTPGIRDRRAKPPISTSSVGTNDSVPFSAQLVILRRELDGIQAEVAELTAAVDTLGDSARLVDPDVQQTKQELARLAGDAEVAALPSWLAAASSSGTAWALIQPLETVGGAMQSKDAYVAVLLRALAAAHRRRISLGALGDTARLLHVELERRMNELGGLLSGATRPASDEEEAESLLALVRVEIGRGQELLSLVVRADVNLRMASIQLVTRENGLLERLQHADATGAALQQAMATVEGFVGATFPGLAPTAPTSVIGGILQVCPVDQPHFYTNDFGAPRWAGGYHPHAGNDIFAPEGTPIRAPFDGLAVRTPNTLGGQAVTIYGDAGYVYNAHLSEYGTVGQVRAGTIIGYVGNSGDAINSAPHDHFEWHPGNGEAVNPFPFLNAVCLLPSNTTSDA